MKSILKKSLKILAVFIISTIIIYLAFSTKAFLNWCNKNQLKPFEKELSTEQILSLEKEEIQRIGDEVGLDVQVLEASLDEFFYENDSDYTSLAEFYDPLGFAVWRHMQYGITDITTGNITISILSGVAISIAYAVISSKKLNNILKFILGYVGVMVMFPPIYMYSYTHRFWDLTTTYINAVPKYFYIGYTLIFILIYSINYIVGRKMTKELNKTIEKV